MDQGDTLTATNSGLIGDGQRSNKKLLAVIPLIQHYRLA